MKGACGFLPSPEALELDPEPVGPETDPAYPFSISRPRYAWLVSAFAVELKKPYAQEERDCLGTPWHTGTG